MVLMEKLGTWHLLSKCFDSITQRCPMTKFIFWVWFYAHLSQR